MVAVDDIKLGVCVLKPVIAREAQYLDKLVLYRSVGVWYARQRFSFFSLVLSGCAASYDSNEAVAIGEALDPGRSVLISTPEDGFYESDQYPGSGRMTAHALRVAFVEQGVEATVVDDCHGPECLERKDIAQYGYYVQPEILRWEERATEWSGKPDRVDIQIIVRDVGTGEELSNANYEGKSQWLTLGGDHPQDLLPEPTKKHVTSLYRR